MHIPSDPKQKMPVTRSEAGAFYTRGGPKQKVPVTRSEAGACYFRYRFCSLHLKDLLAAARYSAPACARMRDAF